VLPRNSMESELSDSGSESWTGIGVVTGFGAVVLMI
jgi:hypothetical protein